MAKLSKSAVVLRFRFGQGLVKARQRYDNTARAIMERVAFNYADNAYDDARKTLEQRVEQDVRAELIHLARLFRRHIVGAAGTKSSPTGMLDTVTKGDQPPVMPLSAGLPVWASRDAEYLRQKRNATGGIQWFDNRRWRTRRGQSYRPKKVGLLFQEMRADTWETMFGPISVRFFRNRNPSATASNTMTMSKERKMKVQIGSLRVRALGRITPAMLPGFTSGTVRANASGNPALMGLIGAYDRDLAYRMGTMKNGIYRPTLEPFLGFFLTRALPHAVTQRIKKGTLRSVVRR